MNFFEAITSGFRNYANFSGRAIRSEFWYWTLFSAVVSVVLGLVVLDMLRLLTKYIDSKKKDGYARIEKTLAEYEKAVDEKTHHEIAGELAWWDGQLRDLRREIHGARDVTEAQRESLLRRCRAVEFEIESSPKWVATAPPERDQNASAAQDRPTATPGTPPG